MKNPRRLQAAYNHGVLGARYGSDGGMWGGPQRRLDEEDGAHWYGPGTDLCEEFCGGLKLGRALAERDAEAALAGVKDAQP
jgi:hypothetical protein